MRCVRLHTVGQRCVCIVHTHQSIARTIYTYMVKAIPSCMHTSTEHTVHYSPHNTYIAYATRIRPPNIRACSAHSRKKGVALVRTCIHMSIVYTCTQEQPIRLAFKPITKTGHQYSHAL